MKRGYVILLSVLFYLVLALYTGVVIPLLALGVAVGAPFVSHQENMRRFRRMIAVYGYGVVKILARPIAHVVYEAAPRTIENAKIFISNHVASSDPFLIGLLPEPTVQVVNIWPFKLPVWGVFARWAGYLNIRAMEHDAFQFAVMRLLSEGTSIVAFPEGTRGGGAAMGPFHGALFRVALAARVPIVPMCITGNAHTPARGTLLLEPATVRVRCLSALPWASYRDMTPFHLKNHIHEIISKEVDRMGKLS